MPQHGGDRLGTFPRRAPRDVSYCCEPRPGPQTQQHRLNLQLTYIKAHLSNTQKDKLAHSHLTQTGRKVYPRCVNSRNLDVVPYPGDEVVPGKATSYPRRPEGGVDRNTTAGDTTPHTIDSLVGTSTYTTVLRQVLLTVLEAASRSPGRGDAGQPPVPHKDEAAFSDTDATGRHATQTILQRNLALLTTQHWLLDTISARSWTGLRARERAWRTRPGPHVPVVPLALRLEDAAGCASSTLRPPPVERLSRLFMLYVCVASLARRPLRMCVAGGLQ
ncbi:hypothetical protein Efla_000517 [Eimeria flavescens]